MIELKIKYQEEGKKFSSLFSIFNKCSFFAAVLQSNLATMIRKKRLPKKIETSKARTSFPDSKLPKKIDLSKARTSPSGTAVID